MATHILWVDNDFPYVRPYVNALKGRDYDVNFVTTVSEAETLLTQDVFNLIILDVMIPTKKEAESIDYPYSETDYGHKTGLVFFKRIKDKLGADCPPFLVMTVRLDKEIFNEFIAAGLEQDCFYTKYALREISRFLKKVEGILENNKKPT